MIMEAVGFFLVIFSYYMMIVEKNTVKYVYAPTIAGSYFVASMFLIERTGAGLNPGRILGLCMMANQYYQFIGQFFGTLLGALLGSLLGSLFVSENTKNASKYK